MTLKAQYRQKTLLPNGIPKWVRCYDNQGETIDRYTVVYTGNYSGRNGFCQYVSMNCSPFHPQGFGQHGESDHVIDKPRYSHLGKRIKFVDLPEDCQKLVMQDYLEIWHLQN